MRGIWLVVVLSVVAILLAADAQQAGNVARVGVLFGSPASSWIEALRQGLRDVGLVEGRNVQDFAGVSIQDGDLLLPAVQIATDQGHEGGLLSCGAVALGLSEPINSAGPFS